MLINLINFQYNLAFLLFYLMNFLFHYILILFIDLIIINNYFTQLICFQLYFMTTISLLT